MAEFRDKVVKMMDVVQDLPTLPQICFELERLLHTTSAGAEDVALIIERDLSLSATILKTANSAYFLSSTSGSIETVRNAVARLGFREVGDIVRTVEIIRSFKGKGPHLEPERFWKHNLMVGTAARFIHQDAKVSTAFSEEESYMPGLLHDIGKLILDQYFPEDFMKAQDDAQDRGISLEEAEKEVLGIDHGEVGGIFLKHWDLPEAIIESVTWHHRPDQCPKEFRVLATQVWLANLLVESAEAGAQQIESMAAGYENVWRAMGIAVESVPGIVKKVTADFRGSAALLGLL